MTPVHEELLASLKIALEIEEQSYDRDTRSFGSLTRRFKVVGLSEQGAVWSASIRIDVGALSGQTIELQLEPELIEALRLSDEESLATRQAQLFHGLLLATEDPASWMSLDSGRWTLASGSLDI